MNWKRIVCAILGHRYYVARVFDKDNRMLGCRRCHERFSMNDPTRAILPWDDELMELYKMTGKWPGVSP